jgi:hypothetical protein
MVMGFVACQGNQESAQQEAISSDTPSADASPVAGTDTPMQDMQNTTATMQQPLQGGITAAPASGEALNPAHGEPGHRCEIPVGAPLSSAPAQTTAAPPGQPVQLPSAQQGSVTQKVELQSSPSTAGSPQTIMANPAAPNSTSTTTAPGMNPPHGQPGHDCNIPVGAPLKK